VISPERKAMKVPFLNFPLLRGTKNNGWTCNGDDVLTGGC